MSGSHFKADCRGGRQVGWQVDTGRAARGPKQRPPAAETRDGGDARGWRRRSATLAAEVVRKRSSPAEAEAVLRIFSGRGHTSGICSPSDFFSDEFARRIEANRAHEKQRWIFDLIAGHAAPKEEIFLDCDDWMLVRGSSYSAPDVRYLVIFKDLALRTIRDLRLAHVDMLRKMQAQVRVFLCKKHANHADFRLYFHYLPSVFQLHLHVCGEAAADSSRTQLLSCVVRNLNTRDTWYRDALILFSPPRSVGPRRIEVTAGVTVADENRANLTGDKPGGVCI
jgi:hypothetical protein